MALIRTRALVLQTFAYSETSKILRLLTGEFGVRSVIAKGAMRPRSRFGGLLEPFTEGEAQFYLKDGRELHTLAGFDLLRSRQSLGANLTAFAGASLLAEIVLRAATEEPHPELLPLLSAAFDRLIAAAADSDPEPEIVAGVWRLIGALGYRPQVLRCSGCGCVLGPAEPSRFDVEGGASVCTRCRPAGRLIEAGTRADLARMIAGGEVPTLGDASTHRALLRAFLAAHLAHDRPLRSLSLLLQLLD
jgi:DNA repair protein RecO (recombination protein O)